MKDGRTSISIDQDLFRRIKVMSSATGRTLTGMIEVLLKDSTGYRGTYPCIVAFEGDYLFIAPTGNYGDVNEDIFHRFLGGGLPFTIGERWDDTFDSMEEACETFGREVCRWTTNGLTITNLDDFMVLYNRFVRREKANDAE